MTDNVKENEKREGAEIKANEYEAGARMIPKRVLSALLSSVEAGVVPRRGAPYIAIGRVEETAALLSDLDMVAEGGGSTRFIIGRYGSGKSFLMQLVRGNALERGFLTCDADLSPERRLNGGSGTGIATYRELIRNLASKSSPDGGALQKIISGWLTSLGQKTAAEGLFPGSPEYDLSVKEKLFADMRDMEDSVGGFDFAAVTGVYYSAYMSGDEDKKSAALKWLRGEYSTKTEARNSLGIPVSGIIDDDNWYDYLKLFAVFARKLGYLGLVVFLDECGNLYKIANRISRENNYEKLLAMFNDTLGGRAPGLALIFGGTPQFLEDTRRGLYSYEALRSRLADSSFTAGYKNMMGPVIRLRRLSDDELLALTRRLTVLHAAYHGREAGVTDDEMIAFLTAEENRAGADTLITPREMIRDYLTILNVILQNPDVKFSDMIGRIPGGGDSADADADAAADAAPCGEAPAKKRNIISATDIEI